MSNSSLVNYTKLSPHYDSRGGKKITDITIHHMAGNLTVYQCGEVFQTREASSNYGVDSEGRVGLYVDEKFASWANGNFASNQRSITIEVADDQIGGNWHVSDKALAKTIALCVDICKRNGIKRINYTGDTSGNLTMHKMFMATSCPGPYLASKFPYIAAEINKRLTNGWVKEGGYWYYYKDGEAVKNGWAQDSKKKWFYLGSDGKMVASSWIKWKDDWYYLKSDGAMAENEWAKDSKGKWFYLGRGGKMLKSCWVRWKNNMYYLQDDGEMATGSRNVPCKFDSNGKLVSV